MNSFEFGFEFGAKLNVMTLKHLTAISIRFFFSLSIFVWNSTIKSDQLRNKPIINCYSQRILVLWTWKRHFIHSILLLLLLVCPMPYENVGISHSEFGICFDGEKWEIKSDKIILSNWKQNQEMKRWTCKCAMQQMCVIAAIILECDWN